MLSMLEWLHVFHHVHSLCEESIWTQPQQKRKGFVIRSRLHLSNFPIFVACYISLLLRFFFKYSKAKFFFIILGVRMPKWALQTKIKVLARPVTSGIRMGNLRPCVSGFCSCSHSLALASHYVMFSSLLLSSFLLSLLGLFAFLYKDFYDHIRVYQDHPESSSISRFFIPPAKETSYVWEVSDGKTQQC